MLWRRSEVVARRDAAEKRGVARALCAAATAPAHNCPPDPPRQPMDAFALRRRLRDSLRDIQQ